MLKNYLQKINDVYFISKLIKKLNKNFELYFNIKNNMYEIYDNSNMNIVVTYKNYPDDKLIEKLLKTNQHNMKTLFNEIDEYNNKLTVNNEKQLINNTTDKINTIFNYFNKNPGKELTNIQIKNILEKED